MKNQEKIVKIPNMFVKVKQIKVLIFNIFQDF